MEIKQKKALAHFLHRPLMFIYQLEKEQIVAFIAGFKWGSDNNELTEGISLWLNNEHKIFGSNQGWPWQVQQYADKKGINWFDAFRELAIIVHGIEPGHISEHETSA